VAVDSCGEQPYQPHVVVHNEGAENARRQTDKEAGQNVTTVRWRYAAFVRQVLLSPSCAPPVGDTDEPVVSAFALPLLPLRGHHRRLSPNTRPPPWTPTAVAIRAERLRVTGRTAVAQRQSWRGARRRSQPVSLPAGRCGGMGTGGRATTAGGDGRLSGGVPGEGEAGDATPPHTAAGPPGLSHGKAIGGCSASCALHAVVESTSRSVSKHGVETGHPSASGWHTDIGRVTGATHLLPTLCAEWDTDSPVGWTAVAPSAPWSSVHLVGR